MTAPAALHIGLVGPQPPPAGGMAMQTLQLRRLLSEEGLQVTSLATNAPYRPSWIEKIQGLRAVFRLLPFLWRSWALAGRVDVIHIMSNSGWSWQLFTAPVVWSARLRGTPTIVNYRGGDARRYFDVSFSRVKPTLESCSRVVVPSGFLREVFADFGVASQIIPNIIDLELFCPGPERSANSEFTVAITRNLESIYGIEYAVRGIALLRGEGANIRLQIAGSGPLSGELESLVTELGLADCVEFMGRLERDQVVRLYQQADAMLNPTLVDNMPNSVLEALACGVPVVSTSVGGVPFIVEHERTALLVPPRSPEAIADALRRLMNDAALQAALAEQGREEVARYSWSQVKPQWLSLYQSLAEKAA